MRAPTQAGGLPSVPAQLPPGRLGCPRDDEHVGPGDDRPHVVVLAVGGPPAHDPGPLSDDDSDRAGDSRPGRIGAGSRT